MSKSTLRQKIKALTMGKDDKALYDSGITYKSGNLTKEGRKVVLDHIFKNEEGVKSAMVDVAHKILEENKSK